MYEILPKLRGGFSDNWEYGNTGEFLIMRNEWRVLNIL